MINGEDQESNSKDDAKTIRNTIRMLTIREKYETNVKITTPDHDEMETVPKTIEVG